MGIPSYLNNNIQMNLRSSYWEFGKICYASGKVSQVKLSSWHCLLYWLLLHRVKIKVRWHFIHGNVLVAVACWKVECAFLFGCI